MMLSLYRPALLQLASTPWQGRVVKSVLFQEHPEGDLHVEAVNSVNRLNSSSFL